MTAPEPASSTASLAPAAPSPGAQPDPSPPSEAEGTRRNYSALAAHVKTAAQPPLRWRVYGHQETPDGAERYELLIVRVPSAHPARFRVLINGGTHGDEPAGAEAVVRFLRDRRFERWPDIDFSLLPCTNPWGYAHAKREGPGGVDLNRSFRRAGPQTREVGQLKRALARQKFDMYLDCHEDVDAPGLYVFSSERLGRAIVEAAGKLGPLHLGPMVDGEIPLENSVVNFGARRFQQQDQRAREQRFRMWPLPRYIGTYHLNLLPAPPAAGGEDANAAPVNFARTRQATIETPVHIPMEQRIAMHLAGIDAALDVLTEG